MYWVSEPAVSPRLRRTLIKTGVLSLAAYLMVQLTAPERPLPYSGEMIEAARLMEEAIAITSEHFTASGRDLDETVDPNRTGLIGSDFSRLTTTLGNLEAKRTTTNPNTAALIVHFLREADVTAGDTVAIGCSASFPALMVASLAAARAIGTHVITIISLGASSWGATGEDFTLLDIYLLLLEKGVFDTVPAAVSLGGDKDVGEDFEPDLRASLISGIESGGIPLIYESDLTRNVALRMEFYGMDHGQPKVSAFINIGGSYGNLGISPLTLKLRPGLNRSVTLPPADQRGVLFEMAAGGVPIIHLLYMRGLALRHGLPWDPLPLPEPGESRLYAARSENRAPFWLILACYLILLGFLILHDRKAVPEAG